MPEARYMNEADRDDLLLQGIQDEVVRLPREDELTADTAKALTVIEEARDKLAEVRETIPQLALPTAPRSRRSILQPSVMWSA